MRIVLSLIRKNLLDSRWILAICSLSLFGLCWLFVFAAHRVEVQMMDPTRNRAR